MLPVLKAVVNHFESLYNKHYGYYALWRSLPGTLVMADSNEWSNPNLADPAQQTAMLARLEDRARCPDQQSVNAAFINAVNPRRNERLLEVGCGSGVLCRLAAKELDQTGNITGIDIAFAFLQAGRKMVLHPGSAPPIDFSAGRAENLPFVDRSFDTVFTARLLLHVVDPEKVVNEMVRVVKPGGRVVLMDWDFDTVAVDHANRELTRRLIHWRTDHLGGNNWSGRKLFGYLAHAGLTDLKISPMVSVARSEQDSLTQSLWNAARIARDQNIFTGGEYETWTGELQAAMKAGHFNASIVYFIVSGGRI